MRFAIGQVSRSVEASLTDIIGGERVEFFAIPVGFLSYGDRQADAIVNEYESRRQQIAAEIDARIASAIRSDPAYVNAEETIKQIDKMNTEIAREMASLESSLGWATKQQSSDALLAAIRRGDAEAEAQLSTLRTRKQRLSLARTAATKERDGARDSIVAAIKATERAALLARVSEIAERIAPAVVREFAEIYAAKRVAADLDPLRP